MTSDVDTSQARWVTGMFVRPSALAPDVYVPFEALETRDWVAQHAGPLDEVKAWCERYMLAEYEQCDLAVPPMQWVQAPDGAHALLTRLF